MSCEELLSKLEGVIERGPNSWIATCPAHDDDSPSLNIREVENGRILIHCFAGCGAIEILEALNLPFAALFPDGNNHTHSIPAAKRLIPRDVIAALAYECIVVMVAACAVASGHILTSYDTERLRLAAERLHAAVREVGL